MVEKLSITVTEEQARRIRERVEAGEFASASEVVRSALQHWQHAEDVEYERRIESIRKRLLAARDNPIRHSSDEIRDHIADLVRAAEAAAQPRKRANGK
jgi:antitoxin ParD1/3/4